MRSLVQSFHPYISTNLQPNTKRSPTDLSSVRNLSSPTPFTILITMSSTTTKIRRQLAEINSLSARLSTTKSNRSTQIEAINQLKMRRVNEYTILLKLRDEPDQKDREAQFADSIVHLEGMDDIESQRARALRQWTELGSQLQRACEELSVLEQEISELEQILSCWNFMEMLGAWRKCSDSADGNSWNFIESWGIFVGRATVRSCWKSSRKM